MQVNTEGQQLRAALDDIARIIVDRCHQFPDWGGNDPYDGHPSAARRVLALTKHPTTPEAGTA